MDPDEDAAEGAAVTPDAATFSSRAVTCSSLAMAAARAVSDMVDSMGISTVSKGTFDSSGCCGVSLSW